MSELKCCPFCGGELEYSFLLGASECKGCGVMIGFPKLTRHEDKIIATNTRKPMDNIVEKLEERRIEYELSSENAPDYVSSTYRKGVMRGYEYSRDLVKQEINNGLE